MVKTTLCGLCLAALAIWTASAADRQIINGGVFQGDITGDTRYIWSRKDNANFIELFNRSSKLDSETGLPPSNAIPDWLLSLHVEQPLNGKRVGLTGDGVTDDYPALQAAIDSIQNGGTTNALYLPPGVYLCSQTLTVTQPLAIYGDNFTGKWDSNGRVFGAHIVYTGTNCALDCQTYRVCLRNLRLTSTANARFGIKMKGEESYLTSINVGTTPGLGFQIGIYCENASISTFRDCILSCNTEAGMWLDTVTGACSSVELDRMHFYHSPIGLRLTASSDVRLTGAWFEACANGVYADNTGSQNLILQNITISGNHYLNNPAVPPNYAQGRFVCITNASPSNSMEVRGLKVSENHVLNLSSDYDIVGYFGSITPVIDRLLVENNNFWGSGVAVFKTDNALFAPVFANNSVATAPRVTQLPGETPVAPFHIQGTSPSILLGTENQETAVRIISGKQPGWSAFIQGGTNVTDTAAKITVSRLNSGTARLAALPIFSDTLNLHGELNLYDTGDVVAMRILPNDGGSGVSYIQIGQSDTDGSGVLRITRKDSALLNFARLELRVDQTDLYGYLRLPNNTWYYGQNAAGDANVAAIGIDSANQVSLAPGGGYTTIGGGLKMGNTPGITANINLLIAGGTTNQLRFVNGLLTGNVPQ